MPFTFTSQYFVLFVYEELMSFTLCVCERNTTSDRQSFNITQVWCKLIFFSFLSNVWRMQANAYYFPSDEKIALCYVIFPFEIVLYYKCFLIIKTGTFNFYSSFEMFYVILFLFTTRLVYLHWISVNFTLEILFGRVGHDF